MARVSVVIGGGGRWSEWLGSRGPALRFSGCLGSRQLVLAVWVGRFVGPCGWGCVGFWRSGGWWVVGCGEPPKVGRLTPVALVFLSFRG